MQLKLRHHSVLCLCFFYYFVLWQAGGVSAENCYYPNGSPAQGMAQCGGNSDFKAMCCPQKWTCLSNGLCAYPHDNLLGRYTCTDQAWGSSCLDVCTQSKSASGNEAISKCSDGSYCCNGDGSVNCCGKGINKVENLKDGTAVATIGTAGAPATTKSSSSSPITPYSTEGRIASLPLAASASSTTLRSSAMSTASGSTYISTVFIPITPSSVNTPVVSSSSSLNIGTIVGCAVGIPLGFLALALAFLFLRRKRAASAQTENLPPTSMAKKRHHIADGLADEKPIGGRAELDSEDADHRFSIIKGRMELPGESATRGPRSWISALPQHSPGGASRRFGAPAEGERDMSGESLIGDSAETTRYTSSKLSAVELPVAIRE